ncbi:MAG: hypothetical protein FD168_1574 [Desulfobulbaceae bacterium]|nr:MAG: hypothetical protein FD168_1574 [Desulfobulbaceae bacterium]
MAIMGYEGKGDRCCRPLFYLNNDFLVAKIKPTVYI